MASETAIPARRAASDEEASSSNRGAPKQSWAQTTLGTIVIQGGVGPAVGAMVGAVIAANFTKDGEVDWLLLMGVAGLVALVVFLVFSVVLPRLRALVWGNVARLFKWLCAIRPTTLKGREALEARGYRRRQSEVEEERKRSPRPTWRVSQKDDDDFIYLHNSGYRVDDVVVRADPELFVFADGADNGFIKGPLGDNARGSSIGKQVAGTLTREGAKKGVTFTLSWIDQNGDKQPGTGGDEMPSTATLPPKPPKKTVRPAWQVGKPREKTEPEILALANGAEGFVGKNVVIDADPSYFTFILRRELGDLEGMGVLRFAGRPTEAGTVLGVTFTVTYEDANGDKQVDYVPAKFGFGTF